MAIENGYCTMYRQGTNLVPMSNNTNRRRSIPSDLLETTRIPVQPMRELVYGCDEPRRLRRVVVASRPMAVRKFRLKLAGLADVRRLRGALIVLALVVGLGSIGCATAPRPVEVESVGQLSASSSHVYSAAVHATTDLAPSFGAVDTDEDVAVSTKTTDPVVGDVAADAPAVETKVAHGF